MEVTSFLIRVIFLMLPGIVANKLYQKLIAKKEDRDWGDYLDIILFSITSYTLLDSIEYFLKPPHASSVFDFFLNEKSPIVWYEIVFTCFLGMILALLASYLHTNQLINRLAHKLNITSKFGAEDVWEHFCTKEEVRWVLVRDHKVNLSYYGYIEAYSDSEKDREMLLKEVSVHDNLTGIFIYNTNEIYISRNRDDFTIEVH